MVTSDRTRLVLMSFLMLFVELAIIRWAGANIYYLFAFANFILIASFLGIGLGFLRAGANKNRFSWSPILLAVFVFFCYLINYQYQPVVNSVTDNLDYAGNYFTGHVYPIWLSLPLTFLTVTALMAAIADGVAGLFKKFTPLQAYRLEVLGSLLGIAAFSLLSFFQASPLAWGVIICGLFSVLLASQWRFNLITILQILALSMMVSVFAIEAYTPNHYWSSYYKIVIKEFSEKRYVVDVNGLAQQIIESVALRKKVKPFYFLPYQHLKVKQLNNVLVIGAGTGGDVAIALAQGAKHVDAVEIDATLAQLGRIYNPDRPYFDPRVTVIINDGRAFLENTKKNYDLIVFALTDSLFLIPGQSSLRLENYLYTLEGLTTAKQHLTPQGSFVIYNYYGRDWLVNRLGNTLDRIYHHAPCIDLFSKEDYWATVLTISPATDALTCQRLWHPQSMEFAEPITDDHPFFYLQNNRLPLMYAVTLLSIFGFSLFLIFRQLGQSFSALKKHLDLFFMGAAFLLLETKSIIQFALLFGTTWLVNAMVFMAILSSVYLAIETANRYPKINPLRLYGGLCLALLVAWVVPNAWLLTLSPILRFIIESVLVFSPVFMANLIFAERFNQADSSTDAFGVNILGAVLGGLLEYCALIVGYHALLILVASLYGAAILLMRNRGSR